MPKNTTEMVKLHYNVYRMTTPCKDCPFIDRKALHISKNRLSDIKSDLDNGGSFNCHKTVYPDVFDTDPSVGLKMCCGAYDYLKSKGKTNAVMRFAEMLEVD